MGVPQSWGSPQSTCRVKTLEQVRETSTGQKDPNTGVGLPGVTQCLGVLVATQACPSFSSRFSTSRYDILAFWVTEASGASSECSHLDSPVAGGRGQRREGHTPGL